MRCWPAQAVRFPPALPSILPPWRPPRAKWGLRALAALLMAVSGQAYRPRFEALERLFDALAGRNLGKRRRHPCTAAVSPRPPAAMLGNFRGDTLLIEPEKTRKTAKSAGPQGGTNLKPHRPSRLLRRSSKTLNLLMAGITLQTPYLMHGWATGFFGLVFAE